MKSQKKVLIVAAHQDDEVLGAGGTIAKHIKMGDVVKVIFVADGVTSRVNGAKDAPERNNACFKSLKVLGVAKSQISFLNLPDNKLDSIPLLDIVQPLEKQIQAFNPEIIYTHFPGDLNIDHQVVYRAVITASRPLPGQCVKSIYAFEILSSTEWGSNLSKINFAPNHFVNISDVFQLKMKAIECYSYEMRKPPHARSMKNLEALAIYRGSSVGFNFAEAFALERSIAD